MALSPPGKPNTPLSTGEKFAIGGLGLAVVGSIFAVLSGGKKSGTAAKPGLGKPGCGPCGR